MRTVVKEGSTHAMARKKLLACMKKLSAAGEKALPGERELCEILGVSRLTVKRVVQRLVLEGSLRTVQRKGVFITEGERAPTVGFLMGRKEDYTFLRSPQAFEGALSVFNSRDCKIRVLQLSAPERLKTLAAECELDGCLWNITSAADYGAIDKAMAELDMPSLAMLQELGAEGQKGFPRFHVATDYLELGRRRAALILSKGHKKVARLNASPFPGGSEGDECEEFRAAFAKAGAVSKSEWSVRPEDLAERVPQLVAEGVTAAQVNGGAPNVMRALDAVLALDDPSKLALLIDYVGQKALERILSEPRLNVLGISFHPARELGVRAAQELLDAIAEGRPAKPMKVPPAIRSLDWCRATPKELWRW